MTRWILRIAFSTVALLVVFTTLTPWPRYLWGQASALLQAQEADASVSAGSPDHAPVEFLGGRVVQVATCRIALRLPEDADDQFVAALRSASRRMSKDAPFSITVASTGPGVTVTYSKLPKKKITDSHSRLLRTNPAKRVPEAITVDPAKYANLGHRQQVNVLMHEIGHLLGLAHSPTPNTVMYRRPNATTRLTAEEATALTQVGRGCAPREGQSKASEQPKTPTSLGDR